MSVNHHDKTKTSDRNDLELGTVVVLDGLLKLTDFGFQRSMVKVTDRVIISSFWHPFSICGTHIATNIECCAQMHYRRLLPADHSLWQDVIEYTSPQKFPSSTPHNMKLPDIFQLIASRHIYNGWPQLWRTSSPFESAWICISTFLLVYKQ